MDWTYRGNWHKNLDKCVFPALFQDKLNGIFGCMIGDKIYSRLGHWFYKVKHIPPASRVVYGELYAPNTPLQEIASMVRQGDERLQFWVHDIKDILDKPVHVRIKAFQEYKEHPVVRTVLIRNFDEMPTLVGEGAVIKDSFGQWFKIKRFETEEFLCVEAILRKSLSLVFVTPEGERFSCGSFNMPKCHLELLKSNPPVGKKVTLKFVERTKRNVPRHSTVIAVRDYE